MNRSEKSHNILIPNQIAIAIITYYSKWYKGKLRSIKQTDKIRGDLALELIRTATNAGYQLVVADGKSSHSFKRELAKFKNVHVIFRRGKKRSPAKRQAFQYAAKLSGVKVIVATEPEKVSLLKNFVPNIALPILNNQTDIVIPKRDLSLFKKFYPHYQFESETEGNKLYNEYLKTNGLLPMQNEELDFLFGPRAIKNDPKIIKLFLRKHYIPLGKIKISSEYFDPEEYSNTLFFPTLLALKKGYQVKGVEIPFVYPLLQKKNEEIANKELFMEKRKSQKMALLIELMYFLKYLNKR